MNPLIRFLLSITTIGFVVYTVWAGYLLLRGAPVTMPDATLLIVFLALSCTYLVASAIQKGTGRAAARQSLDRKVLLYETLLLSLKGQSTSATIDEAAVGLYANVKVLQAWNHLRGLQLQGAPREMLEEAEVRLVMAMRSDLGIDNINVRKELGALLHLSAPVSNHST